MANNRLEEEKEYQDAIRYTSSIIGDMKRAIEETAEASDLRNKKIFEEISLTKKVLNSLKDEKSYDEALIKLAQQKNSVLQTNFGVNDRMKNIYLAQLDAAGAIVQKEQARLKIINETQRISDNLQNKFTSSLDSIGQKIKGIPIIGETLFTRFWSPFQESASGAIDKVKSRFMTQFKTGFTQATNKGMNMMNSFTSGLGRGFKSAKNLSVDFAKQALDFLGPKGRLLLGIAAVAAGLYLAFKAGLDRFKELDAAAKAFREETGLLNSQTVYLKNNIKDVSTEFAGLGVSAADTAQAAAAFANELKPSEQISKATLGSMVTLNKNFGVGVNEAAQLNKVFQNIGGLTQEQSQYLIGQTAEMAKMAGVAPAQVIQDMAESSEYAYKYFQGSPQELAKAAVAAAKLGTSIAQAGKVADGLLDFESSITAELEASALLGTNLNLSQARYLAANGKILESQQAVLDEVAGLGDLTKLNTFEQEALAKATGMQMSDLINQQRIREQFGKLNAEDLAAANSLMESGRDISKLNAQDLKDQTQRLAKQKEMQSVMEDLSNEGSAISNAFQDMFEPLAANLMPFIVDAVSMISGLLVPSFRFIGSVLKVILAPLGFMLGILGSIGKAVINFLVTPLKFVVNVINSIYELFSSLVNDGLSGFVSKIQEIGPLMTGIAATVGIIATAFLVSIVPSIIAFGITLVTTIVPALFTAVASTITWAISMATAAIAAIASASAMTLGIGAIAIAGGIAAGAMAMKSGQESAKSSAGSINDGVVQNGKIVSTHPEDFLIATKTPGALADSVSGTTTQPSSTVSNTTNEQTSIFDNTTIQQTPAISNTPIQQTPTIDISALVSKMDEMIQAVSSNKDVYMDREKVSLAVVKSSEKSSENRFGLMGA
jgi:hypothetical protein